MSATKLREKVNSIADLRLLVNIPVGKVIETDSYYGDGKGGGNTFVKVVTGAQVDNAGTIIVGADGGVYEADNKGVIYVEQFGAIPDGTLDDSVFLSPVYGGTDNYSFIKGANDFCRDNQLTLSAESDKWFRITKTSDGLFFRLDDYQIIKDINIIVDNTGYAYPTQTLPIYVFYTDKNTSETIYGLEFDNVSIWTSPNTTESITAAINAGWNDLDATGYSNSEGIVVKCILKDFKLRNTSFKGIDRLSGLGSSLGSNTISIDNIKMDDMLMGIFINNPHNSSISNITSDQNRGRSQLWHIIYIQDDDTSTGSNNISNVVCNNGVGSSIKIDNNNGGNHIYNVKNISGTYLNQYDSGGLRSDFSLYLDNGNASGLVYILGGVSNIDNCEMINRDDQYLKANAISIDSIEKSTITNIIGQRILHTRLSNSDLEATFINCTFNQMLKNVSYANSYTGKSVLKYYNVVFESVTENYGGSFFTIGINQTVHQYYQNCNFNMTIDFSGIANKGWIAGDNGTGTLADLNSIKVINSVLEVDATSESLYGNDYPFHFEKSNAEFIDTRINIVYNSDNVYDGNNQIYKTVGGVFNNVRINDFYLNQKYDTSPIFTSVDNYGYLSEINSNTLPKTYSTSPKPDIYYNVGEYKYRLTSSVNPSVRVIAADFEVDRIYNINDVIKNTSNVRFRCVSEGNKDSVLEPTTTPTYTNNGWEWEQVSNSYIITSPTYELSGNGLSEAGTGTILNLSNTNGTPYNMAEIGIVATYKDTATYTITGAVTNGFAQALINTPTLEPTVTGATKVTGATWVANTDMKIIVSNDGNRNEYYFLSL